MTWDPIWEGIYRDHGWGGYPNEDFIRFVARNYYRSPNRKNVRILEIGCGNGSNVWFLAREGFDACGVDGAPTAIAMARQKMQTEGLEADLRVGDVGTIAAIYGREVFDAVGDIGCLQCNSFADCRKIVNEAHAVLKPGGKVFAMVAARGSYGDGLGHEISPGTFVDIAAGPLKDRGLNHFFTVAELHDLFGGFRDLNIEYAARSYEGTTREYKTWLAVATKGA